MGNDHKNLLHPCRRRLCPDRASAVDPDLMGWSVTLNGVDAAVVLAIVALHFSHKQLMLAISPAKALAGDRSL